MWNVAGNLIMIWNSFPLAEMFSWVRHSSQLHRMPFEELQEARIYGPGDTAARGGSMIGSKIHNWNFARASPTRFLPSSASALSSSWPFQLSPSSRPHGSGEHLSLSLCLRRDENEIRNRFCLRGIEGFLNRKFWPSSYWIFDEIKCPACMELLSKRTTHELACIHRMLLLSPVDMCLDAQGV